MLTYEYKCEGRPAQYQAIDEAIRVVQFIRNKCLRKWMDERGVTKNDLQCYCAVLAQEYPFAARLNSQARQADARFNAEEAKCARAEAQARTMEARANSVEEELRRAQRRAEVGLSLACAAQTRLAKPDAEPEG